MEDDELCFCLHVTRLHGNMAKGQTLIGGGLRPCLHPQDTALSTNKTVVTARTESSRVSNRNDKSDDKYEQGDEENLYFSD